MTTVVIPVNQLTRGHRKRLAKMGFPQFLQTKAAAEAWDALSDEERDEVILLAVWVASRPLDEIQPGGRVYCAIETSTWRRLFDEWEFTLTPAVLKAIPEAFRAAIADDDTAADARPSFPALEPLPAPVEGEAEPCESCQ